MKVSRHSDDSVIATWDVMFPITQSNIVVAELVEIFKGLGNSIVVESNRSDDDIEVFGDDDADDYDGVTITATSDHEKDLVGDALTAFFGKPIFFNNDIGQFDGI